MLAHAMKNSKNASTVAAERREAVGPGAPVVPVDADERALLSSVERGEWLVNENLSTAKSRYVPIAKATR
jgi:hypothetical protein